MLNIMGMAESSQAVESMNAEELRDTVYELAYLLHSNIDLEECSLDHHGYCQTHYLGSPCEVDQARKYLREVLEYEL